MTFSTPSRGMVRLAVRRALFASGAVVFAAKPGPCQPDPALSFAELVQRGDDEYLADRKDRALLHYEAAFAAFAARAAELSRATGEVDAREGALVAQYTYRLLAASPYGRVRRQLLVRSFLEPKIAACEFTPPETEPVVIRVAAFVVRKTDLSYTEGGTQHHEALELGDRELSDTQNAWRFAMDAVATFSAGRARVETDWIELPGATLRGLTDRSWKGLLHQRHLDPRRIDPLPEAEFAAAHAKYDLVVFVWPRGKAASTYGGGTISLPSKKGELSPRGGIRSLSVHASVNLHEFLHTIEERVGEHRAHGPEGEAKAEDLFAAHGIEDEVGWYTFILRSVRDWQKAKYLEH